jgi:hypothetical protein
VLGDDDRQVAGRKEKRLVTEEPRHVGQGHRAAVAAKFWKCLSLCDAIRVPCHNFYPSEHAEGSNRPIRKLVM